MRSTGDWSAQGMSDTTDRAATREVLREQVDSISQMVYGIVLAVKTAHEVVSVDPARVHEPLEAALRLSEAALAKMRALAVELRPPAG
jgi:signal transduction histidine kinase